jgi:hypothetical protein
VQTWVGGTSHGAGADPTAARYAVRSTRALGADADVVAAAAAADATSATAVQDPGVLLAAYGIDPQGWELVTFTLHAERPALVPADAAVFQVLHVAAPEHRALPQRVDTRMPAAR